MKINALISHRACCVGSTGAAFAERFSAIEVYEKIRACKNENRGAVAVIFAICLSCVIISVGVAIDYGRASTERNEAQQALDTATLAFVRAYVTSHDKNASVETSTAFANANKEGWEWKLGDIKIEASRVDVSATGSARYSTSFMSIFGKPTIDLHVTSSASADIPFTSISLAADISWTMRGARMTALQDALKKFSEALFAADSSNSARLIVNLVPFSDSVNVGGYAQSARMIMPWYFKKDPAWIRWKAQYYRPLYSEMTELHVWKLDGYADGYPQLSESVYIKEGARWTLNGILYGAYPWPGCFQLNHMDFMSERVPGAQSRLPYPPVNYAGYLYCPGSDSRLLAGITTKAVFDTAVDDMKIYWGTAHNAGLLWAKRTLSPDWAEFFGVESRPWNEPKLYPKYVVMLSDGDTGVSYTFGGDQVDQTRAVAEAQARGVCADLKSKGVTVVTISYSDTAAGLQLMEDCASPGFHYAASTSNVKAVFQDIATTIAVRNLRVTR